MEDTEPSGSATDRRDEAKEFGARVHRLRERAGLTLAQLSDKSGVSRAMLSKVEGLRLDGCGKEAHDSVVFEVDTAGWKGMFGWNASRGFGASARPLQKSLP